MVGWKMYMKIREAVAADTAMVNEKIMRKMAIRLRRKLPSKARTIETTRVVGTVYSTNSSDLVMLFAKSGVATILR